MESQYVATGFVAMIEHVTGVPFMWAVLTALLVLIEIIQLLRGKPSKTLTVNMLTVILDVVRSVKGKIPTEKVPENHHIDDLVQPATTPIKDKENGKFISEEQMLKLIMSEVDKVVQNVKPKSLQEAFDDLKLKYPLSYVQNIERVLRLETGHMKSSQWEKCNTAGMVTANNKDGSFPYGWGSLQSWADKVGLKPYQFGTVYFGSTSDGKPRYYVKFPSQYLYVQYMAWFIQNVRGGNHLAWVGMSEGLQSTYASKLSQIKPRFS